MQEQVAATEVSYNDRPKSISANTYQAYCTHYRKALWQFKLHQDNMEAAKELLKWEKRILRSGRPLPKADVNLEEANKALDTAIQIMQGQEGTAEALEQRQQDRRQADKVVTKAIDTFIVARVKAECPDVDLTDEKAVQAALLGILKKEVSPKSTLKPLSGAVAKESCAKLDSEQKP